MPNFTYYFPNFTLPITYIEFIYGLFMATLSIFWRSDICLLIINDHVCFLYMRLLSLYVCKIYFGFPKYTVFVYDSWPHFQKHAPRELLENNIKRKYFQTRACVLDRFYIKVWHLKILKFKEILNLEQERSIMKNTNHKTKKWSEIIKREKISKFVKPAIIDITRPFMDV